MRRSILRTEGYEAAFDGLRASVRIVKLRNMGPAMADDAKAKPLGARSPGAAPDVAREADERRRVEEITRDMEALGHALNERDRQARSDIAQKAEIKSAVADEVPSQPGQPATIPATSQQRKPMARSGGRIRRSKLRLSLAAGIIGLSLVSAEALMPMGAWTKTVQDVYRSAVIKTQRLTVRTNEESGTGWSETPTQNAVPDPKATEEKAASAVATREEDTGQALEETKARAAREMAQARVAAEEAARRQTADDARLKATQSSQIGAEAKPKSDAEVRAQAEKAEAGLKLSEKDRKEVQSALNALGHSMPQITGYFGPRTRAMIMAWQKMQGLPETGFLTGDQLETLRQQAAVALEKNNRAQRPR
jgi:hypothetical protein